MGALLGSGCFLSKRDACSTGAGRLLYSVWSQTGNPATLVGTTTAACTGRTAVLREHETQIRVRYQDADPMGLLHHAHYFTYFEIGRTELLRSAGGNYRRMEEQGTFAVVVKAECVYHRPARYDDVLTIRTLIKRITYAKIEHEYQVYRDGERLATAHVTMALVDRDGVVQRVPEWLEQDFHEGGSVS